MLNRSLHLFIALFVVGFLSSATVAEEKTKLKALLVTGGCCHDYPAQIKIITEGLSQRVDVDWDVEHVVGDRTTKVPIYQNHDWIKPYDFVVHNECFGHVDDVAFVEGVVKAHTETKTPAIFLHCSAHSYRNAKTDEWRKLLGMTSRSHEKQHPLDIVVVEEDHPIMAGFPNDWKVPMDELYKIEKQWPTTIPLAKAYGVDTKKDHVLIWANEYQGARVFSTTLGHRNEVMNDPVYLDLVARGVLWSLDKINEDGTAKAGYEGTGVKPIDLSKPNPDAKKKPTPAKN